MWPDVFWPDVFWPDVFWPDNDEIVLSPFGPSIGPALYDPLVGSALKE